MEETRVPAIIAVSIAMLGVATIALALRCYVRIGMQKTFQIEDYLVVIAWLFYIPMVVFTIFGSTRGGLGRHAQYLTPENGVESLKWFLFLNLMYVWAVSFFKNSFAFLELRLGGARWYKAVLWTSIAANLAITLFLFFWLMLQCDPVSKFWNRTLPGQCRDGHSVRYLIIIFSMLDVLFDIVYAALPIPLIWGLQMDKRNKISVIALLGLGIVASIATLIRFASLHKLNYPNDKSWNYSDFIIWSNVEVGLGITTASVSMLRPLLRRMKIVYTTASGYHSETPGRTWGTKAKSQGSQSLPSRHEYPGSQLSDMPPSTPKPTIVIRNSVEVTTWNPKSSSQDRIVGDEHWP